MFHFCDLNTQQRYVCQEEVNTAKRELSSLVDTVRDSSKFLIKRASVYKFHYRKPECTLDLQSQKTSSLLITITISLNIQIHKVVYRSEVETTNLAFVPTKFLNYTVITIFLQKLSPEPLRISAPPEDRSYVAKKCEIKESNYNM